MTDRPRPRPIELDTLPFGSMMLLLIPLLLAGAQFASLAMIDVALPAIDGGHGPVDDRPLHLTVAVHARGYTVSAAPEALRVLGWDGARELPLLGSDHDVAALTALAGEVKALYPTRDELIVTPSDDTSFALLVSTLDATRENADGALFPAAALASLL